MHVPTYLQAECIWSNAHCHAQLTAATTSSRISCKEVLAAQNHFSCRHMVNVHLLIKSKDYRCSIAATTKVLLLLYMPNMHFSTTFPFFYCSVVRRSTSKFA